MPDLKCLDRAEVLAANFRERIAAPNFPCVGAKSALARGTLKIVPARDITSAWKSRSPG